LFLLLHLRRQLLQVKLLGGPAEEDHAALQEEEEEIWMAIVEK
jgi:hypothetical protein